MELDTKITFLGLMIPELYLFLILAILGGGHIEYGQKNAFPIFLPGILIDLVNRPPKGNNYEGFKTIPIFSRSNPIFMRLLHFSAVTQQLYEQSSPSVCQQQLSHTRMPWIHTQNISHSLTPY